MRLSDSLRWGLRGIRQRKLRAALTILGILVGTSSVIALVSQTQGIQTSIVGQIEKLGSNTMIIRPGSAAVILTQRDVGIIGQIPGVAHTVPIITSQVRVYGAGGSRIFSLIGVDPDQFGFFIKGTTFSQGRLYQALSYSDIVIGSNVEFPQDLTSAYLDVGQSVTLQFGAANPVRKVAQVVGSFQPYGASILASVDDSVFMSLQGALSVLKRNSYSAIFVEVADANSVNLVSTYLRAIYGTNLNVLSVSQLTQTISSITGLMTILLGAISGISLFVAGLGIMNIMFVSVIERTKEIGVLKAVGFKRRDILTMFLSEAALQGIIGGILGILTGTGISFLIPFFVTSAGSSFGTNEVVQGGGGFGGANQGMASGFTNFSYSPVISLDVVLLVFSFALAVALIAGFYPASRASKMDPVVALRSE